MDYLKILAVVALIILGAWLNEWTRRKGRP